MNHHPYTILLIEDDAGDAEIALRALRESGLQLCVTLAHDGVEGLRALGLHGTADVMPPDLVLSDVKMPKVDGPEVLRLVRADERLRNVPFVLFSSSDEDGDVRRAWELGATEYHTKPIGYESCKARVQEIARRWLQWRPSGANVREAIQVYAE